MHHWQHALVHAVIHAARHALMNRPQQYAARAPTRREKLEAAIRRGDVGDVDWILFWSFFDVNDSDESGVTLLHYASRYGSLDVARLLIDKGANVNAVNRSGETPLSLAQKGGHLELAQYLIKHGANKN